MNQSNEQIYFINKEKTEYEKIKTIGVLNGKKIAKISYNWNKGGYNNIKNNEWNFLTTNKRIRAKNFI